MERMPERALGHMGRRVPLLRLLQQAFANCVTEEQNSFSTCSGGGGPRTRCEQGWYLILRSLGPDELRVFSRGPPSVCAEIAFILDEGMMLQCPHLA